MAADKPDKKEKKDKKRSDESGVSKSKKDKKDKKDKKEKLAAALEEKLQQDAAAQSGVAKGAAEDEGARTFARTVEQLVEAADAAERRLG